MIKANIKYSDRMTLLVKYMPYPINIRLNNIGRKGHSCFSPRLLLIAFRCPPLSLIEYRICLYLDSMFFETMPLIPNVFSRIANKSRATRSYAFLKSMKETYNLFLFFFIVLSIIVCNKKNVIRGGAPFHVTPPLL